jgi:hypothetical protein
MFLCLTYVTNVTSKLWADQQDLGTFESGVPFILVLDWVDDTDDSPVNAIGPKTRTTIPSKGKFDEQDDRTSPCFQEQKQDEYVRIRQAFRGRHVVLTVKP